MAAPTDDRRDLLTVIAYMRAAPGKEGELKAALESLIEPTGEEDGYVNYDLAHLATPHLTHVAGIMGGLLDDDGLTINRVRRIA